MATMLTLFMAVWALTSEMNVKAIRSALPSLNETFADMKFIGTEASVVQTIRTEDPNDPRPLLRLEQLCRTTSDTWFIIEFRVRNGMSRPLNVHVQRVVDKDYAQRLLRGNRSLYEKHFGALPQPELA